MPVFAIADTHLSRGVDKPMDIFGGKWLYYEEKLEANWRAVVGPEDWVVIPGDVSWAMSLADSAEDFRFLASLPGKKIIGKGNHDYWWDTVTKMERFLDDLGLSGFHFLYNNAFLCENIIVCGTRGWMEGEDAQGADPAKIIAREAGRLKLSYAAAKKIQERNPGASIRLFTHYPPAYGETECAGILDAIEECGVEYCYYGHIHNVSRPRLVSHRRGTLLTCISADFLDFTPMLVE